MSVHDQSVIFKEGRLDLDFGSREKIRYRPSPKRMDRDSTRESSWAKTLFTLLAAIMLFAGWWIKDEGYYTAKEGFGYILGIIGGVFLLSQFLYPLRKSLRFMRNWGAVSNWFEIHKMVGVVAPVLILFHGNFHLHALNSNVALFSMLLVMASGLVGSHIFTKINYRLYGEKVSLQTLQSQFGLSREEMDQERFISDRVKERLHQFEASELAPSRGFLHGAWRFLTLGRRIGWTRFAIIQELKQEVTSLAMEENWETAQLTVRLTHDRALIRKYLKAVQMIAEFAAYQRIFALWHVLHIPLFIMMLITGVVHVVAVHMY